MKTRGCAAAARALGAMCDRSAIDALGDLAARAAPPLPLAERDREIVLAAIDALGMLGPRDLRAAVTGAACRRGRGSPEGAVARAVAGPPPAVPLTARVARGLAAHPRVWQERRMHDVLRISPQEAQDKMTKGATYVDVRTEAEFAEGHPEGAINVPFLLAGGAGMIDNPDFLSAMTLRFAKDAKIVVGCKSGNRSLRAARAMLGAGFTEVTENRAGWDGVRDPFGQVKEPGWSRAGLPVEAGTPAGRGYVDVKNWRG